MAGDIDNLRIFWSESCAYVFGYSAYAPLVGGAVLALEMKRARGGAGVLPRLALANAALVLLAILCFTLSMLISGWYARALGGEIAALSVTLLLTVPALYFFKLYLVGLLDTGYRSARLAAAVVSALLVAPYAAGSLFVLLLGSSFRI